VQFLKIIYIPAQPINFFPHPGKALSI